MRFINRRRLLVILGLFVLILAAIAGGVLVYINSPAFEQAARRYIIRQIEQRTGAGVSLEGFDLNLRGQRIRLTGLTLRGLEPAGDRPLAHIGRIDVGVNFRSLLQRRIDLFELIISQPELHVIVDPQGRTNFPSPPLRDSGDPFNFQISIGNFSIKDGVALVNERRINIDFTMTDLNADLAYDSAREVLETHLRYQGVLDRSAERKPSIPYSLEARMDYVRGTLLAHQVSITSGATELKLQGKISELLNRKISGRFEYSGDADMPFMKYFFTEERFAGKASASGFLEFASGYFLTRGHAVSDSVRFEDWNATKVAGDYVYHYPERRLSFRKMTADIIGGSVAGAVVVENIPGRSRVNLDIDYTDADAAELARSYPWDPRYRIYSRVTGTLSGWFEGKLDSFVFSGNANFKPYDPAPAEGIVALPLEGSTDFEVKPGEARVANADVRLNSTAVQADGLIHATDTNLTVKMNSSDLRDVAFLYEGANGSGTFDGVLTGAIAKPEATGQFVLENHKYREWVIQRAAGGVSLDLEAGTAGLQDVEITQGESKVSLTGTADLDGAPVDLRIQSNRIAARDVRHLINNQDIDGVFSGNVHLTSLQPVRLEGDVRATDLVVRNRAIGSARGHIRYFEPEIEVEQLAVNYGNTTLTGSAALNRTTKALKFALRANSVDLATFQEFGLPQSIQGIVRQADIRGSGTTSSPNISGTAAIQNLSVYGESFPQAQVELNSAGTTLNVKLDAARNVSLSARVDTSSAGYPFTSRASFTRYPLERIAGLADGTLIVSGNAELSGLLTDRTRLRGQGAIQSAEIRIQDQTLQTTRPFTFDFNPDRLMVSGVTFTGQGTQVNLGGTIAFNETAPLGLDVSGRLDLALLAAAYPEWFSSGAINVEGRIGGSPQNPDLRGVARLTNASLGRRGFFTSIGELNGDLFFNGSRINIDNIAGRIGGGTVRAEGTAVLERTSIQAMNVRIETDDVRVRYPRGLRTVVDGALILRGSSDAPRLEGNIEIQSLTYRSSFEEFLAMFNRTSLDSEPTPFGRLGLAIHVEGSRNITIQNQLADVEARVDVDIKGTLDEPALTGHVEAGGGTLSFQGNRYRILRGNIDFVDPVRIEPVVDIQAETEVREYRIILVVSGRGDQMRLALSSDPPLPEMEIVSLIAGGRTREEYGVGPERPTSEQLFQAGAASILSDLLQQRVGSRLGLFGLDRVRVDPVLAEGRDPGAKITVFEQVTKDLSISYSQEVASNRQQVILIEYFISATTSILASKDETGALGLDIRFRKRFK